MADRVLASQHSTSAKALQKLAVQIGTGHLSAWEFPRFFDVVYVNLAQGKQYNVHWLAADNILEIFKKRVAEYFHEDDESISLLFLPTEDEDSALHEEFTPETSKRNSSIITEWESGIFDAISVSRAGTTIDESKAEFHKRRWENRVLNNLGLSFFTFSKIEVEVGGDRYAAAIWLGYHRILPTNRLYKFVVERFLWSYALQFIAAEKQASLIQSATKAAVSQVMARNMSHNIGSHVLSKFKAREHILTNTSASKYCQPPLGCSDGEPGIVVSEQNADHFVESFKLSNQYCGLTSDTIVVALGHQKEDLENEGQIAYFSDYLKSRMDFLADIATSDPVIESPMFLVSEILAGFDRNRILLNRISGVSDPKLRFRIDVQKDGKPFSSDLSDDIQVSMTNDVLGAQACYIILENVIRNVCKHSKPTPGQKGNITFTINVSANSNHPAFYEISIFDNLPKVYDPDNIFMDEMGKLLVERNQAFTGSILNKRDNTVRPTNLGTIEMDVCAAYLRCLPIVTVEDDDYELDFCDKRDEVSGLVSHSHDDIALGLHSPGEVKADKRDADKPFLMYAYKNPDRAYEGHYNLGYKFYLPKPKEVLIIDDTGDFRIDGIDEKDFPAHGLLTIKSEELEKELNAGTVYKYQFLYLYSTPDEDTIVPLLANHFASLPKRVVSRIGETESVQLSAFMERLWESHIANNFLADGQSVIVMRYKRSSNFVVTSREGRVNLGGEVDSNTSKIFIDAHNTHWCRHCHEGAEANAPCECSCDESKYSTVEHLEDLGITHVCRHCDDSEALSPHCECHCCDYLVPMGLHFYDMMCGHSRIRKYIGSIFGRRLRPKLEYLEVALSKILIIDERIQENIVGKKRKLYKGEGGETDFYHYFRQQGIWIPLIPECEVDDHRNCEEEKHSNCADLNNTSFGTIDSKGTPAFDLARFIKHHLGDADFCVIHLGLLEKILGDNKAKDSEAVLGLIEDLFKGCNGYEQKLIITSGRGTPDNLPEKVKFPFVPLAPIQNAVETLFDKYVLSKLLYNTRRTSQQ